MSIVQDLDPDLAATSTPPLVVQPAAQSGLWFNDGTWTLKAGMASSSFRVYGGLLAAHSPVFHDMLEFPQSEDAPTVDGWPVVLLSDAENDLRCFLKALFDDQQAAWNVSDGSLKPGLDSSPISRKNRFRYPVGHHSAEYEVSNGIALQTSRGPFIIRFPSPSDPTSFSPDPGSASWSIEDNRWIWIIVLGRERSLDWILPLALYPCAMCTVVQLLNGIEFDGRPVELSSSDKLLCIEQMISVVSSVSLNIIDFFLGA
jgi:hypothetical protein